MALMRWREKNQARWVGIRPGHRGTQIAKEGNVTADTAIIHTVNDDKTFYLCLATFSIYSAGGGSSISVRNVGDAHQYYLALTTIHSLVGFTPSISIPFNPPLEIPEKWDIVVTGGGAAGTAYGFVFGWEE